MSRNTDYNGNHVEMITVSDIVSHNALAQMAVLQENDANITPKVVNDLQADIAKNMAKLLGTDKAKILRQKTQDVNSVQSQALPTLQFVKDRVDAKYKEDATRHNEILNSLGYKTYLLDARKGDQEALVQLLFRYQQNMTKDLKDELKLKGIPETKLDAPVAFAKIMHDANTAQEFEKEQKVQISDEMQQELNALYARVIDICKLGFTCFKGDPIKQRLFSYGHLLKTLNNKGGGNTPPPPPSK